MQGVCDSDNIFLSLVAKWPGNTHDAYILRNSPISDMFETGQIQDGWLLGDSAYGLKPWLLTPVLNPRNASEGRYNSVHKKTRCVIERTYGIWKMRFRCLDKTGGCLMFSAKRSVNIIISTGVLHNLCMRRNIPLLDENEMDDDNDINGVPGNARNVRDNDASFDDDDDVQEQNAANERDGRQTRTNLINTVFS